VLSRDVSKLSGQRQCPDGAYQTAGESDAKLMRNHLLDFGSDVSEHRRFAKIKRCYGFWNYSCSKFAARRAEFEDWTGPTRVAGIDQDLAQISVSSRVDNSTREINCFYPFVEGEVQFAANPATKFCFLAAQSEPGEGSIAMRGPNARIENRRRKIFRNRV